MFCVHCHSIMKYTQFGNFRYENATIKHVACAHQHKHLKTYTIYMRDIKPFYTTLSFTLRILRERDLHQHMPMLSEYIKCMPDLR